MSIFSSGGLLMIPIILCGIFATYIIFERLFYFNSVSKKDVALFEMATSFAKQKQFDKALQFCENQKTPAGDVLAKVFKTRFLDEKDATNVVLSEASRQIPKLKHLLTSLGTIANISTLLGLLGTVVGNIQAFGVLGDAGSMGNPALLAGAIAKALFTTAGGLAVSIPSVIFYNHFTSKVSKIISHLENEVTDILLIVRGKDSAL